MNKTLTAAAIAIFVISGCSIQPASAEDTFLVCAIMPLTGEWALFAQEFTRGIELAVQDTTKNMKFIVENDNYELKNTVTAARKLINEDGCQAIIVPFVETAKPMLPIAKDANVPVIVLLDRTNEVEQNPHFFSVGYSVEEAGRKMARYAVKNEAKKAAIIVDQIEYTLILGETFEKKFVELGGEIVMKEKLVEEEDFLTLATKIEKANPDVIYFAMTINEQDVFVRRVRERFSGKLLLAPASFSDDFIASAGEAAENVCKTDLPYKETPDITRLLQMYEERNAEVAMIPPFVMLGYDGAHILSLIAEPESTGKNIIEALSKLEYDSVTGEHLSFEDGGGVVRVEDIYCVHDGVAVPVE